MCRMQMIRYFHLVILPVSKVYNIQQCLLLRRRGAWVPVLITLAYRTSRLASVRAMKIYEVHEAVNDLIYPNSHLRWQAHACSRHSSQFTALVLNTLLSCLRDLPAGCEILALHQKILSLYDQFARRQARRQRLVFRHASFLG